MYCPSCGRQQSDDARFCASCGTATPPPVAPTPPAATFSPQAGPWTTSTSTSMPHLQFDIKRLTAGDFIVGGASFALMIGIFLPWFGYGSDFGSYSFSATVTRTWMWLPFFITLAIVGYLVAKMMLTEFQLPLEHWVVLLVPCGADLLLSFLCFATKPGGLSWDFGAYFSLLVALAAVIGSLVRRTEHVVSPAGPSLGVPPGSTAPFQTPMGTAPAAPYFPNSSRAFSPASSLPSSSSGPGSHPRSPATLSEPSWLPALWPIEPEREQVL